MTTTITRQRLSAFASRLSGGARGLKAPFVQTSSQQTSKEVVPQLKKRELSWNETFVRVDLLLFFLELNELT